MKIAFATRSGTTITAHFGRMRQYVVVEIDEGREIAREARDLAPVPRHDADHHRRHGLMLAAIDDCDVVVAGGMGFPIQQHAIEQGLEIILTSIRPIDEALARYLAGDLGHEPELAHDHGRGHDHDHGH